MKFVHDDGGRAAAGFKGSTGDCVARAIAIATGHDYAAVYRALAAGTGTQRASSRTSKRSASARNGINTRRKWFREYMASLGWEFVPTMSIGSGCTVHLVDGELPPGRLVVSISKHYTAVVDGVIHDTHDPSRERGATLYPANTPADLVPKGAVRLDNGNGWSYAPERCVYGYWREIAKLSDAEYAASNFPALDLALARANS